MKSFKEAALWVVLFFIFMGVGYFHGQLPSEVNSKTLLHPVKVGVFTTDDLLFPPALQQALETEMNVQFEVNVTHDWNELLAKTIANPSADLIFMPSYWAHSLAQQNLLSSVINHNADLLTRFSPDFMKSESIGQNNNQNTNQNSEEPLFLPLYWMKTDLFSQDSGQPFLTTLKDKKKTELFLWGDEDLLLAHFDQWKNEGLLDQIKTKKLLTMSLKDLAGKSLSHDNIVEMPLNEANTSATLTGSRTSALITWGVSIPKNSAQKDLALKVLMLLTNTALQEKSLEETPFASALQEVGDKSLPLQKRAAFIRNLNLNETILLEKKDPEARKRLQSEYGISL